MINFFNNMKREMEVKGKGKEIVVLTRFTKSTSRFKINNVFSGLLQDNTQITDGDLLIDGMESYLVVGKRKTYRSTQALLYKTNATIDVVRLVKHFTKGVQDGYSESLVEASISTLQDTISASMKQLDAGLLPNTVKKMLIPKIDIQLLDRIKLGNENYQVDAIDDTDYSGILAVQCSIDKRKVV